MNFFFFWSSSRVTRNSPLKVNKWGIQGSNPNPCIYNAMSLPIQLSSRAYELFLYSMYFMFFMFLSRSIFYCALHEIVHTFFIYLSLTISIDRCLARSLHLIINLSELLPVLWAHLRKLTHFPISIQGNQV